ncbi:uncharacterized protein LOC124413336 [Diprion similis]|uniref:uncharacterized protein LOC124413336 n=1 Tax=Diprion similis TaxID=362088 RepID=UPI001EF77B89|nr:uncharacterized protein LOC124413336 [Diprion similis]
MAKYHQSFSTIDEADIFAEADTSERSVPPESRIQKPVTSNETIAHFEVHGHQPFASSTFGNNDEIRISVQNQNECVLPEKISLHIHGKVTKEDYSMVATTKLVNMAVCQMFEEIRYELNGVEIDRNKSVGITSIMKGYLSLTPGQQHGLENTGRLSVADINLADDAGNFDIFIPLRHLLGFAEDYRRFVVNAKHQTKDSAIPMSFCSRETYVYPMLPSTTRHVWAVKTSTQLEKPRYVIMGFQTARKNEALKNANEFDHCRIRDVKLFLNSQCYPYGNLNLDISNNQYVILYDMYVQFQTFYCNKEAEPLLSKSEFINRAPLIVIDCSKQNESLKTGPVDIRLEFKASVEFPQNTAAYCMILHDRVVEYSPISGTVKKLV